MQNCIRANCARLMSRPLDKEIAQPRRDLGLGYLLKQLFSLLLLSIAVSAMVQLVLNNI